jgi:hypothetical protein
MCNGPTNAIVCNKTLIQMSHIKTLKITPTCFDHQLIIIREFLILVKITGKNLSLHVWLCGSIRLFVLHVVLYGYACRQASPQKKIENLIELQLSLAICTIFP